MELSKTAATLLKEKIGYRNDDLSTGIYTIGEIIEHETEELQNEDIFDTCKKLYGTTDIHQLVRNTFGETNVYGIWLVRKEDVIENYAEDGETEISIYQIPEDALILSDIEDEGVLFATKEYPRDLVIDKEIVKDTMRFKKRGCY